MEYEEIEVEVRQLGTEPGPEAPPLVELLRRLVLASIGAVATTRDEAEQLVGRLVAQGEEAQRQGQRLVRSFTGGERSAPAESSARAGHGLEASLEQLLSRLNIPSRRDVDELHARLARLSARVDELTRTAGTQQPHQD